MTPSLLLLALVAAEDAGEKPLELSLPLGVGFHERSDSSGTDAAFHVGLCGGYALASVVEWPLRAEVMVSTSTSGPPWGSGVDAVEVSRLDLDLVALVGGDWTPVREGTKTLGVEGLLGPRVRLTRVGMRVYDESEGHYAWGLAAKGFLGPIATYGAFRLSLRAAASLPSDGTIELWLSAGLRL